MFADLEKESQLEEGRKKGEDFLMEVGFSQPFDCVFLYMELGMILQTRARYLCGGMKCMSEDNGVPFEGHSSPPRVAHF